MIRLVLALVVLVPFLHAQQQQQRAFMVSDGFAAIVFIDNRDLGVLTTPERALAICRALNTPPTESLTGPPVELIFEPLTVTPEWDRMSVHTAWTNAQKESTPWSLTNTLKGVTPPAYLGGVNVGDWSGLPPLVNTPPPPDAVPPIDGPSQP